MPYEKKKILMVTSKLDAGGAEKWCHDTLINMDLEGMSIDYYYFEDMKNELFLNDYKKKGVNVFFGNLNQRAGRSTLYLRKEFTRFIREYGPYQTIHINGLNLIQNYILLDVAQKEEIATRITHCHNPLSARNGIIAQYAKGIIRKQIIEKATALGACSCHVAGNKYGQASLANPKLRIIKNGIDTSKIRFDISKRRQIKKELGLEANNIYLFVGRLAPEKNLLFLVRVFSKIVEKDQSAFLVLVGSGPEEESIIRTEKELGINNRIIHIPWSNDVTGFFCAGDVFMLPSIYEGFPIVSIEAQSCGIPCLISDTVPKEVNITGKICFLSLTEGIEKWARKAVDMTKMKRYDGSTILKENGYDINDTSYEFRRLLLEME